MENRLKKELSRPEDFTEPAVLYEELEHEIRSYHPSADMSMIRKAYELADNAHKDQRRKSGEAYIIHPLCVAIILAELELDKETIVAGILHDVVEDTVYTKEQIAQMFNEEVALLVDGVTKLGKLSYSADKVEIQAENLRKMFLAMAKDIRVILIKLADRLHNMRTLQYMPPHKQQEKSRETIDIYSPIANRLGISKIKIELDDLALCYLKADVYEDLSRQLDERKTKRDTFISNIVADVKQHIDHAGIEAEIDGRVKHFFSIYKKMVNQNKGIDQIYDLFAVRIKVETVKDCYAALGMIHEMYKPIPGRFKDYIAMPKQNMYQSLHTTLIGPEGQPFEIQIRTYEMHRVAEYGIAAHWKYKEGSGAQSNIREEEKLSWLRQILEWQQDFTDNKEFMSLLKTDLNLFNEEVYCFTPSGDVKSLPAGSTPIDFAYSIHSAVGNKMVGARVNGQQVPITHQLQNGDRVEIVTSQNSKGPSRDWLGIVKSTQAKSKINAWFKSQFKEENIVKGKELIDKYCKAKGIVFSDLNKPEFTNKVMLKYGFKDWDSICASVGHGGLKEGQVVNKLVEEFEKTKRSKITDQEVLDAIGDQALQEIKEPVKKKRSKGGIVVKGVHDVAVRFSKCCSPVPGDEIVGYVTRGRGVSIHRTDCVNVLSMPEEDRKRLIDAEWQASENENENEGQLYITEVLIYAVDRMGIFVDISKTLNEMKINIVSFNARTSKRGKATIMISFETSGTEQLNRIISKLRNIDNVIDIERTVS